MSIRRTVNNSLNARCNRTVQRLAGTAAAVLSSDGSCWNGSRGLPSVYFCQKTRVQTGYNHTHPQITSTRDHEECSPDICCTQWVTPILCKASFPLQYVDIPLQVISYSTWRYRFRLQLHHACGTSSYLRSIDYTLSMKYVTHLGGEGVLTVGGGGGGGGRGAVTLCQLNVFRPCRMRVCTLLTRV